MSYKRTSKIWFIVLYKELTSSTRIIYSIPAAKEYYPGTVGTGSGRQGTWWGVGCLGSGAWGVLGKKFDNKSFEW